LPIPGDGATTSPDVMHAVKSRAVYRRRARPPPIQTEKPVAVR
jgi:hypothetical protein